MIWVVDFQLFYCVLCFYLLMQVSNIINLRIADIVNDHLFLLIKFYKVELKSVLSCAIVKTYFFVSKAFFALPVYLSIRNVVVRVRKQGQVHYPNHFPSVGTPSEIWSSVYGCKPESIMILKSTELITLKHLARPRERSGKTTNLD